MKTGPSRQANIHTHTQTHFDIRASVTLDVKPLNPEAPGSIPGLNIQEV